MNYLDRNEFNFKPSQLVVDTIKNFDLSKFAFYTRIYDQGKKSIFSVFLSEQFQIDEQQVLLGYGAEDLLKKAVHFFLTEEGSNRIMMIPKFSWWYYANIAAEVNGKTLQYNVIETDDTFKYDFDALERQVNEVRPKVLLVATPNNPTGNGLTPTELEHLCDIVPKETVILVDEAYASYVTSDTLYIKHLVETRSNIVFCRTLSKFYGLPGLRLGFGFIGKGDEMERFAKCSKYDISAEMNDYRRSLIIKLRDSKIEELNGATEELEMAFGRSGRETMGGEVLDFWMRQMQSKETMRQLMVHRREYDAAVIEQELEQFPESMYYVWKENRDLFVSKILYMHIPRESLWRFVSGIAYVEMAKPVARCIDITAVSKIVDTVLPMDINDMKEAELLLSRVNDKSGHAYDAELERLRNARDAKVASGAEPRRIGQIIGRQNNIGNTTGLEELLNQEAIRKLLE